jgi:putative ABC transport system permease protein
LVSERTPRSSASPTYYCSVRCRTRNQTGWCCYPHKRKVRPSAWGSFSWTRFEQLRDENRSFSGIAAFTNEVFNITGRDDPEQLAAARVSWNFLQVLGIQPALGRSFAPQEDQPGGPLVALLSDNLWRHHFGGAPSALGRHITLDQKDYTIIGVLPAGFRFDLLGPKVDLVTTRLFDLNLATPQQIQGGAGFLNAVARLARGVALPRAQQEMNRLAAQYRAERPGFPDTDPATILRAGPLREDTVANYRPAVLILFGAVALVLCIACGNVASLLPARAFGRRRDTAVRTALGAGRGRLVRQFLTESITLALAGGAGGIAIGLAASLAATRLLTSQLSRVSTTDARTFGGAAVLFLAVAAAASYIPARRAMRVDPILALRQE